MGTINNDNILVTKLERIKVQGGDVLHAMKDMQVSGFVLGEAYFSLIEPSFIKAWKRHKEMTLNLVVPIGKVKFVFYDGSKFRSELIGEENYVRLTIPPGIWFGFQGIHKYSSLILNLADVPHNPTEVERCNIEDFNFRWSA
jgi:dTDP-4-dehydrorhamnose 3,5-epimerase